MATIFLSYAHEDVETAQQLFYALQNLGHAVFFDKASLAPGKEFNFTIIDNIRSSDFIVFLLSPEFCAEGSYCRTEVKIAESNWPRPDGKILPVMVRKTPWATIPHYISSVTVLQPHGNLLAETVKAIQDQLLGYNKGNSITSKVRKIELNEQLEALDAQWEAQKEKYLLTVNGEKSEPTTGRMVFMGAFVTVFSLFTLHIIFAFANPLASFSLITIKTPIALAIGALAYSYFYKKYKEFERLKVNYQTERENLTQEMSKL